MPLVLDLDVIVVGELGSLLVWIEGSEGCVLMLE